MYHVRTEEYFRQLNQLFGGSEFFWTTWFWMGLLAFAFFFGLSSNQKGVKKFCLRNLAVLLGGPLVWAFAIVLSFFGLCIAIYCKMADDT